MTDLLTPTELAVMLGMSVRTLANWRSTGKGPPYFENRRGTARRTSGQAQSPLPASNRGTVGFGARIPEDGGEMRNGTFVQAARVQSSPDVKSDGKARVNTGKPTLTQQDIDVDGFIRENHALIEKLRKGTR